MSVADLLESLVLSDWRFWIEDGKLKYRAPRDATTPELLDRLKARRSEIVAFLETSPERLNVCPLSYGQRALWFLWKLSPQSSAYNLSLPLRIAAEHAADDWRAACAMLTQLHPMLRTVFPERLDGPVQAVTARTSPDWTAHDASGWSEEQLAAAMAQAHGEPFDLAHEPVVRFRWFARAGAGHILLITMHHIVSDGWSLEIIRRQLPLLHDAVRRSAPPPEPAQHSYEDYARWQLAMLRGADGERLWDYWRTQLAAPLPVLDLPTDRPRPAVKTYAGGSSAFALAPELSRRMQALARDAGVTSYVAFMAAFLLLLHRYSGQDDLLIGSPNAGRSRAEFAPIVGYFVDPIVIRSTIARDESFGDFLRNVQRTTHDALAHADFPFALIVERLHPERDPGRSPLFDVSFNYHVRPASDDDANAAAVFDVPQADGKFDLTLTLSGSGDALTGAIGFNTDLFQPATIARLCDAFVVVLETILDDPNCNIDLVPLTRGSKACRPILAGPRRAVLPQHMTHLMFEAGAAAHPDAVAIHAEDAVLTYAELNRRANGLAQHLRELGATRDALVGIAAKRSAAFMVALLAIHKAGAAYVPLDPSHPQPVLRHMIAQAEIRIILTDGTLIESPDPDMRVISLSEFFLEPGSQSDTNPTPQSELDDLAYVIFTSGSTGMPKGVAVTHRALANYVQSMLADLAIAPASRFALVSTVSADLGHTVIFPALCSGGCLHMVPEQAALDGSAFVGYMQRHAIDYLKIVPSHFAALTSSGRPALPRKALIFGGEGTSRRWVASLLAAAGDCAIFNHYGPTETTVGVLTCRITNDDDAPSAALPLRVPAANTDIYLLDRNGRNVMPGMSGELCIGGECLARGYINAPELTEDSFISLGGVRLYRTGDLARQLPNGDIEILGRRDRQVKVRGYRVELAQVEAALRDDPSVRQCVVLPDIDEPSAGYLAAFVVATPGVSGGEAIARDLRRKMERALPPYMIPARIVMLDEMPLTRNGKIDTHALRRPTVEATPQAQVALPRDAVELELTQIWSDILELPSVGIHDDFFRLGGHSLLAVRLAGRIHEKLGRSISLAALFTSPTIAALADLLRTSASSSHASPLVPIKPQGSRTPLIFLPGAGGNVLYFYPLSCALDPDQPCWGLQALGLDPATRIPASIEQVAAAYIEVLRKEAQATGPYVLAGHSFGALVAFEMARLLLEQGEEIAFLGLIDNAAPGAMSEGPEKSESEWLRHIALRIGKLYGIDLDLGGDFASKSYDGQVDHLIDRMIASGLLPHGLNKDFFGRFIEVYKANAIAASRYRPASGVSIPVTLFRAAAEDSDLNDHAASSDPTLGWNRHTARVDVIEAPGTHLTMFSAPHVQGVADRLTQAISRGWTNQRSS